MTELQKYQRGIFIRAALYGAIPPFLVGLIFFKAAGALRFHHVPVLALIGLLSGFIVSSGISTSEGFLMPALRDRPIILSVLLRPLIYFVSLGTGIATSIWLFIALQEGASPFSQPILSFTALALGSSSVRITVAIAIMLALVASFLISVSRKLGPGEMRNWMLGRYHQPREEERIFMFLDMKDSTALAEQLGNLKFSALVRDFFVDLTPALLESHGAVSHYIGDEAVISWPLQKGLKNSTCMKCFARFAKEIESRAEKYRSKYGVVPGFKAGMHCGMVIATEVGTLKSEIVFHGDVLNTTARITSLCSELEHDFLISGDLAASVEPPINKVFKSLGSVALKGKSEEVELFAVVDSQPTYLARTALSATP